ncbi:MAG: DUF1638 domain-containing protein [Treponema sp.]|jgi:hypothetical protein|nr:DUF1638 domain-containing protein [Treponema sp.]
MPLHIVSCGIFQEEFEKIIPEIKQELKAVDIQITYLPSALHNDNRKLGESIKNGLEALKGEKIMLLYGDRCHPDLSVITKDTCIYNQGTANCIELILGADRKKELDKTGNIFYMTSGWLKFWRDIFQRDSIYGMENPRIIMEGVDKIIVLDTGTHKISDEEILELYDCVQIPIEIETIGLDYFKKIIIATLKRL